MTVIDDYLTGVDPSIRPTLERLRTDILATLGPCDEVISYAMPGFRLRADNAWGLKPAVIAGFQTTRTGGSYYPHSGAVLDAVGDAVSAYGRTKSALHFTAAHPLPADLVRRLVDAKLAQLRG